jgi:predicted MFS family arabinose efflux permease
MATNTNDKAEQEMQKPAWAAIFANTLVATVLTTSELLPISILTPMAEDLHITEGEMYTELELIYGVVSSQKSVSFEAKTVYVWFAMVT